MEESNIWYNDMRGPKEISLESRTTVNALRRVATTVTVSSPVQRFRTIRRARRLGNWLSKLPKRFACHWQRTLYLTEHVKRSGKIGEKIYSHLICILRVMIIHQSPFAELYFPRESSVSSRSRSTNQTKR